MSIGSIDSSSMLQYTQGAQSAQRPDPSQFAQKLFSQIDTSGQGYLDKSELQSALDKVSLSQSGMAMSADDLMAKLDANGDGKVTEGEFSDALKSAGQQVHGHHHGHHGHHGGASSAAATQDPDNTSVSASSSSGGGCDPSSSASGTEGSRGLMQMTRLMQAYNSSTAASSNSAQLAVAA